MREINTRYQLTPLAPLTLGAGAVASALIVAAALFQHPAWWTLALIMAAATAVGAGIARRRDIAIKTVHLWFDLSSQAGERFGCFEEALGEIARSRRIWSVDAERYTGDWKHHAGASVLVARASVHLVRKLPAYFQCNIRPFSLAVGDQTLYFFPDRVLVYHAREVGSISYDALEIGVSTTSFRESGRVPSDAEVVGHTWRYVNKDGGPDRRFSNNERIPICRYDEIILRSPSGLNILLMVSKTGVGVRLRDVEANLIPLRQPPDADILMKDADQEAFERWRRATRN